MVETVVTGQSDVEVSYTIVSTLVLFLQVSKPLSEVKDKSAHVYPAKVVLDLLA